MNKQWMREHWVELASVGVALLAFLWLWLHSRKGGSVSSVTYPAQTGGGSAGGSSGGGSGSSTFDASPLTAAIAQLSAQQAAIQKAMADSSNQNSAAQAALAHELAAAQAAMDSKFAALFLAQQQGANNYQTEIAALEAQLAQTSQGDQTAIQQLEQQLAAAIALSQSQGAAASLTGTGGPVMSIPPGGVISPIYITAPPAGPVMTPIANLPLFQQTFQSVTSPIVDAVQAAPGISGIQSGVTLPSIDPNNLGGAVGVPSMPPITGSSTTPYVSGIPPAIFQDL